MNWAGLLRRLAAIEAAATTNPVESLAFVGIHNVQDADTERCWRGDRSAIDRHANPGTRSIVVSAHEACRASWEASKDMTEEQRESHEMEEDRKEAAGRAASARPKVTPVTSEPRHRAVWGYGRNGEVIYEDDPRLRDGIGAGITG